MTEHNSGKGPNSPFMTHCHREIYDAQWDIILDDEFLVAYAHGIAVQCGDGVWCRFYPGYSPILPTTGRSAFLPVMKSANTLKSNGLSGFS